MESKFYVLAVTVRELCFSFIKLMDESNLFSVVNRQHATNSLDWYFEPGPFNYPPQTALNYLFKSSYLKPFAKHITRMKAELTLHNDVPLYSSPVCFSTAKVNFPTIKMIALVLRRLFMTTSMKCAPHNPTVNNTDLSNPNHVLLSQAKYNIRHKLLY